MKIAHCAVVSAFALAAALSLAACSSPPGPVQPMVGPKAPGVLVIEPSLQPFLDVPNGEQNFSYNKLGFLEYNTVVRNKGSRAMTLSINADYFDDAGRLLESQDPIRFFIDPNSEKALQIAANSREAKKMRVQIRPAK